MLSSYGASKAGTRSNGAALSGPNPVASNLEASAWALHQQGSHLLDAADVSGVLNFRIVAGSIHRSAAEAHAMRVHSPTRSRHVAESDAEVVALHGELAALHGACSSEVPARCM